MISHILLAAWILFPAGVANSVPVIVMKFPILKDMNYPADFGLKFRSKRVLGSHKTIRGFITGIAIGTFVAFVQKMLFEEFDFIGDWINFDYLEINPVVFGLLSSIGALVGDSTKSFFKRRVNIQPGKPWIPFDQIDSILGFFVFTIPFYQFDVEQYIVLFIVWGLMHPVSTVIGYVMRFKDSPI